MVVFRQNCQGKDKDDRSYQIKINQNEKLVEIKHCCILY